MPKEESYKSEIRKIGSVADVIKKTAGAITVYDAAARAVRSSVLTFRPGKEYSAEQKEIRDKQFEEAGRSIEAYRGVVGILPDLVENLKRVQKEIPKVKGAGSAFDVIIRIHNVEHAISKLADAPDKKIAETYSSAVEKLADVEAELKEKFKKFGLTVDYMRTH